MQFLTEDMITCRICDAKLTKNSLPPHLRTAHNKMSSKDYYNAYLKKEGEGLCLTCGKPTKYQTLFKGYKLYCSNPRCSQQSPETKQQIKEVRLAKNNGVWNVNYKEKRAKTCREKYGEDVNNLPTTKQKKQHTREINNSSEQQRIKYHQTCLERYGKNPNDLEEVKQKKEETCLKHYGVKNPMLNAQSVEKLVKSVKDTCLKKYGVSCIFKLNYIRQKAKETRARKRQDKIREILKLLDLESVDELVIRNQTFTEVKCLKCNIIFETCYFYLQQGYGKCPHCYPKQSSIAEMDLKHFIEKLGISFIPNAKIIAPYELDIFIPEKSLAIEYNGLYWHSENQGRRENYHVNKLNLCKQKAISLIQIFEDEWKFHPYIVEARLKQILGVSSAEKIYARKCFIKEIPSKIKNEFLIKYHLQGTDNSPVNLGAFYNDKLIAVMTFNHGSSSKGLKKIKEDVWELNRYCCDFEYRIPGIASKLLSYFKKNYQWSIVFSYADRRWSEGNMYSKLGFKLEKITKPNYWYIKGKERLHRFSFRKKRHEAKEIPEWALRSKEGYARLWDCGSLKFVIKNEKGSK